MSSSSTAKAYDLVVIGAGPGGYVAAVRAAQLGLKTCVVERDRVGGVCLNWGCIPSKNLIHQAEQFRALVEMERVGVHVDRGGLDYAKVQAESRGVVNKLTGGVESLLRRHKIDLIKGQARLTAPGNVAVEGGARLRAKHILVATGSRPMAVPGFECDGKVVMSSDHLLASTSLPKSIVILGGGAIGCEFAFVLNAFGVAVTLVEAMDHLLPSEDAEAVAVIDKSFRRHGIDVRCTTRATALERHAQGAGVSLASGDGKTSTVQAERVLVVFGRVPNTDGIGLAELGVKLDRRGFVEVGDHGRTSVPGVYAIGDITATPALAHVASREGEIAVEHMAGHASGEKRVDPARVPSAIYCEPQLAGFGLREDEAQRTGRPFTKSVFAYPGAGKSIAIGKPEGLVKILACPQTGELLGAHVVGHNATELIHELLLAADAELLAQDIAATIHAHPTLSEAVMEAARGLLGKAIHA